MQVIDGHYPHVMPHSSNLSFWEKGMTSDIGHTWIIGVASLPCAISGPVCVAALCHVASLPPSWRTRHGGRVPRRAGS